MPARVSLGFGGWFRNPDVTSCIIGIDLVGNEQFSLSEPDSNGLLDPESAEVKGADNFACCGEFIHHRWGVSNRDDGSEEAVLSLETGLIFGQELVKVMEEYPVERGAFRMSGTVNSCHSRDNNS